MWGKGREKEAKERRGVGNKEIRRIGGKKEMSRGKIRELCVIGKARAAPSLHLLLSDIVT